MNIEIKDSIINKISNTKLKNVDINIIINNALDLYFEVYDLVNEKDI